jgi:predicted transcriptional regulator of viral defense system
MKAVEAYADLARMKRPVLSTGEAATRWGTERVTAGRRLRAMESAGLARHLRRGLWTLEPDLEPFALPPFLTAPYPAYVSFSSALARHGLIEQIPRQVSAASLDRARKIETSLGTYEIHHLAADVFGGYQGSERGGYIATPEKALFDAVYVRAAAGSRAYFPELSLPAEFDRDDLRGWTERIESKRLRTIVARRLREVLASADTPD